MASSPYEPPPRLLSFSSVLDDKFIVYGGKNVTPESAYSYNPLMELWSPLETTGAPTSKLCDGAAVSHEGSSFMFGGYYGSSLHNSLYQLVQNNKFSEHKFSTEVSPMKKRGCRMIAYNKSLLLFGGDGDASYPIQPGSELIGHCTNELHSFNLEEGTWSSPVVSGTRPPPCTGFSFTKISDNIAVLFGGFNAKLKGICNDVYILDLTNMHWSKLPNESGEPCPMIRWDPAAVCLGYGGDHPKLLVIGGNSYDRVWNDVWMLDLQSRRWKEIKVSYLKARSGHCAGALVLSSRLTEVIIFGGRDFFNNLSSTTVLRFECANGEWRLIETLGLTDLATNPERLREKEEQYNNFNYLDAYLRILATRDSLEMLFVKMIFLGPPRLGKTTARRRLTGEIADISSAAEAEQPSTGAVESGGNVVVRNISSTTALMTPSEWSFMKDLTEEARMLLQFIYNRNLELNRSRVSSNEGSNKEIYTEVYEKDEKFHSSDKVHSDKVVEEFLSAQITSDEDSTSSSLKDQGGTDKHHGYTQIPNLFRNAVNPKYWKDIKRLFKDSALLKMEDTGGQPEFMDMLPALTIGPAIYLLFCKLIDDLFSRYTVSYLSPSSGESTTSVESSYTVEEVLLTALASVSCFSSYSAICKLSVEEAHSSEVSEILTSSFKSVAYIVGTHRDLVSEEQIEAFDHQLQHSIRSTDFFREDLIQFSSEKRMILAIDNMNGGAKEIEKVRKFLERGIHQHFRKLRIPASWLVFSLCLRVRTERISSLDDCHQLAKQLNMPSKETKIALWFLHHYAGFLMYFPDLPELEDTVICDTQIIYDSVTNLIINTFKFGSVSKWASERFRETGQFSLEDIRVATSKVSGDYIPLKQLVKLLEHLNIIAPIVHNNSHPFQTKPIQSLKVTYFMPCVLQNASSEELDIYSSHIPHLPASLMIRYKCGFVPLGIFPAIIAHLVGHSPLKLIEHDIKKNCVQFRYGTDYDKVILVYRTKYCEIHIERERNIVTPTHEVCVAVREIIESTLKAVSSRMNYAFSLHYQLSFECPTHPGEDHLCVVDSTESIPHKMNCLKNGKNPQPVDMQSQHLVWFGKALADSESCTSESNLQPEGGRSLSLVNIKTFLKEEDFPANKAGELGIYLGIKPGRISTLESDNHGNSDKILTAILSEWLEIDGEKSWEKLAKALGTLRHLLTADKLVERRTIPLGGCAEDVSENLKTKGSSRTHDALSPDSDSPRPKHHKLSPAADSADVRKFSEDLSSGDLYRYLLFKRVPKRDCDIIKEREISGLCFLSLTLKYWESCGVSEPGVIVITKLQDKIKATQTTITPNPSPHVPVELHTDVSRVTISSNVPTVGDSTDVREFSEDLSSGDLYRYLLFKNVPKRDCDIIKEEEISGLCFLELSKEDWNDYRLSRAGFIVVNKLQEKIKAKQTDIATTNPSPHVPAPDYQAYMSSLSPCVLPLLEQQLDWDHGGVDIHLNEIADHMLDWEDRLSTHLGLTHIDISDIKEIHLHQPPLQRREALKRWRNRHGLHATYGNLLKLCVEAGHTECAQVICDILKRKSTYYAGDRSTEFDSTSDRPTQLYSTGDRPTQFDSTGDKPTQLDSTDDKPSEVDSEFHYMGDMSTEIDLTSDAVQFDSTGGVYHDTAHGVVIRMPEGAIPENLVINLDVKATLTSTLKLPEDYRSVSPITELCIKDDPQFKFLKPIEVILPHFLDIKDHETLPICFMKAEHGSDHFKHLEKNQEQSFDYHNYATLKTNHLCHLCIAAGMTEVRDKFNLIRVIPQVRSASGWSMYFYVIYDLPTCKSVINEHYENREESYEIISCDDFKLINDHLEIIYDENLPKGWILACASSKQVHKDSVHYDKFDEKILEERCDKELYPPRFIINVIGKTDDPIRTTFTFKGADRKLQSQVILSLTNEITYHPHENALTSRPELISLMNEVAAKIQPLNWKMLAIQLGLSQSQIEIIKTNNNNHVMSCFSETFDTWKHLTKIPYTWSSVLSALRSPIVNEEAVADELKEKLHRQSIL